MWFIAVFPPLFRVSVDERKNPTLAIQHSSSTNGSILSLPGILWFFLVWLVCPILYVATTVYSYTTLSSSHLFCYLSDKWVSRLHAWAVKLSIYSLICINHEASHKCKIKHHKCQVDGWKSAWFLTNLFTRLTVHVYSPMHLKLRWQFPFWIAFGERVNLKYLEQLVAIWHRWF